MQSFSIPEDHVITLDLHFLGKQGAIAAYLIPHRGGAVLVESGPSSTIPALLAGLQACGLTVHDVTDVLLTHVHLDHAGAAGWLALQGARIHVHPTGAPHLLNPQRLLESAARIYGDQMQALWGEVLPVPAESLAVAQDGVPIVIQDLRFRPIDTPGHANHHFAYRFEDVCFTGDIGGVRLGSQPYLELPLPPPDIQFEKWRFSLERLCTEDFKRIAPTHFGIYSDPAWHLEAAATELNDIEKWMEQVLPENLPIQALTERFVTWSRQRAFSRGVEPALWDTYQAANPAFMSAHGIMRYWEKYRFSQP